MSAFLASLGPFGWIILGLFVFGLFTARRAMREMLTRPWKADKSASDMRHSDDDSRDT